VDALADRILQRLNLIGERKPGAFIVKSECSGTPVSQWVAIADIDQESIVEVQFDIPDEIAVEFSE
jgi:hypothetical protein